MARLFCWVGEGDAQITKLDQVIDPKTGEPRHGWHELTPPEKQMLQIGEGAQILTTPEERKLVTNAVIKTLRYFEWLKGDDAGKTLLEVANDVERRDGAEDNDCCPVCEEVLCDDHCPFHGFRNPYDP